MQGYFAISRQLCHFKATWPFLGNFAISRLLCRFKTTLSPMQTQRLQGQIWSQQIRPVSKAISCIFDSPLLLSERQINPTMQGDFATNVKQFCHQCKLKDSRVIPGHPWSFPLIRSYGSYRQMNATVKAKPTKNFSSKRKLPYHKIRRSACFSPTFLFV